MTATIYYSQYSTPIGKLFIAAQQESVIGVFFEHQRFFPNDISQWEEKSDYPLIKQACAQLYDYFSGKRIEFSLPLLTKGTPFQQKVWDTLLKIPYGKTVSYLDIADQIGNKKAFRAVATAIGRNPVSIVIPCHRVIGTDHKLHGYAGGLDKKQFLLTLEQKNTLTSINENP